jgi:hypothetical protein
MAPEHLRGESGNTAESDVELDLQLKRLSVAAIDPAALQLSKQAANDRTNELLFDMFPQHIAEALRDGRKVAPESLEHCEAHHAYFIWNLLSAVPFASRYAFFLVILGLPFQVQPLLGVEGDPMRLLFERDLTPHAQYCAAYKLMREPEANGGIGAAQAVVHLGYVPSVGRETMLYHALL